MIPTSSPQAPICVSALNLLSAEELLSYKFSDLEESNSSAATAVKAGMQFIKTIDEHVLPDSLESKAFALKGSIYEEVYHLSNRLYDKRRSGKHTEYLEKAIKEFTKLGKLGNGFGFFKRAQLLSIHVPRRVREKSSSPYYDTQERIIYKSLKQASRLGYKEAFFSYAIHLVQGIGTKIDYVKAIEFLSKLDTDELAKEYLSRISPLPPSQRALEETIETLFKSTDDIESAFQKIISLAISYYTLRSNSLAYCCIQNIMNHNTHNHLAIPTLLEQLPKNRAFVIRILKYIANTYNSADAIFELANLSNFPQEKISLLEKAAKQKHTNSLLLLGELSLDIGQKSIAIGYLETASHQGSLKARYELGLFYLQRYEQSSRHPKHLAIALHWLHASNHFQDADKILERLSLKYSSEISSLDIAPYSIGSYYYREYDQTKQSPVIQLEIAIYYLVMAFDKPDSSQEQVLAYDLLSEISQHHHKLGFPFIEKWCSDLILVDRLKNLNKRNSI